MPLDCLVCVCMYVCMCLTSHACLQSSAVIGPMEAGGGRRVPVVSRLGPHRDRGSIRSHTTIAD